MEVNYDNRVGGKSEKKKLHLNLAGGGGGIGGLVLLGGGLAVAALVAACTVFKKKNTRRSYDKNEQPIITDNDNQKSEVGQGLNFVLQTPPETTVSQNSRCTGHEESTVGVTVTHIHSCELASAHSLVLEDKPVPIINGDGIDPETSNEEILFSDGCSKDGVTSSYDILSTEEFSLSAPDDEAENVIKNESVKGFQFIGTIALKKKNEAVDAEVLAREENLPMLSLEVEGEEDCADDISDEEGDEEDDDDDVHEGKFAVEENSPMQEVLPSDDSDEESIAAGDDILCNERSSSTVSDGPSVDESENMINDDSRENLQYTESIQLIKEDDKLMVEENSPVQSIEDHEANSCEEQGIQKEEERSEGKLAVQDNLPMQSGVNLEKQTEHDGSEEHASETVEEDSQEKLAVDENSATQQVEEEEEEDSNGDDSSEEEVTEEEEDSSEAAGSSSMESKGEAIWPAEMIDAPSQGLKEMNVNYQNIGDKIVDDERPAKAGNHDSVDCQSNEKNYSEEHGSDNETTEHSRMMLNKKAAQQLVTVNELRIQSSKRGVWFWSMMVLLLLLLIVHRIAILLDLPYHDYVIVP